jgi:hypothetical protein
MAGTDRRAVRSLGAPGGHALPQIARPIYEITRIEELKAAGHILIVARISPE